MAGPVRQPIDIPSLERYIIQHAPLISTPLDVKQVSMLPYFLSICTDSCSGLIYQVRLWSIQPNIPPDLPPQRHSICPPQEAPRQAALENRAPSRARIPHSACPP
ncbi:hypothetical protein BJX70DRAFT_384039 [Aspergillus crustosus]